MTEANAPEHDEKRYAPECYACPIGTASMAVQRTAPEATEHLLKAGREMLSVARSLLEGFDAFLQTLEERAGSSEDDEPVDTNLTSIPIRRDS